MDLLDIEWDKVESTARGLQGHDTPATETSSPRERRASGGSVRWATALAGLRHGATRWVAGTTLHRLKVPSLPL